MSGLATMVCVADFEREAERQLDRNARGYYNSGADDQQTLRENVAVFQTVRLRPRGMVDISHISLKQRLQGREVAMPIGVAPTAMQRLAHPDGECASARAAEALGAPFILSTIATSSIEEVAAAAPRAVKWFQLYVLKDRSMTARMVRRAEQAGFSALVLTVDAQLFGKRLADARNQFKMPAHLSMANFDGELKKTVEGSGQEKSGINNFVATLFDPSLTWADVSWLRSVTSLPVVVKGVMTPEDALQAAELGCAGVIVSNHGGRQLDGCLPSLRALPAVVAALAGRCPVYMDGGVRRGTDALKALALGAQCVFVGRPLLWGLAVDGENGARKVLQLLQDELRLAMGLCGVTKIEDIDNKIIENSQQSLL